jgi:Na+/H+-translocating membrane pyrophosphatase
MAIVQKSSTGAGTNVIAGLATGMISTFPTVLLFAAAIWTSYALAGFYGVALAASAMMATTAMQLAIDAFGPISDNAGGIAEMSELPKEVRTRTDILDSVICCLCNVHRNRRHQYFQSTRFGHVVCGWHDPCSFLCISNEFCWKSCYGYGV